MLELIVMLQRCNVGPYAGERYGHLSIHGEHIKLGSPTAAGMADRLESVSSAQP